MRGFHSQNDGLAGTSKSANSCWTSYVHKRDMPLLFIKVSNFPFKRAHSNSEGLPGRIFYCSLLWS